MYKSMTNASVKAATEKYSETIVGSQPGANPMMCTTIFVYTPAMVCPNIMTGTSLGQRGPNFEHNDDNIKAPKMPRITPKKYTNSPLHSAGFGLTQLSAQRTANGMSVTEPEQ
jgi:hypothetical protein